MIQTSTADRQSGRKRVLLAGRIVRVMKCHEFAAGDRVAVVIGHLRFFRWDRCLIRSGQCSRCVSTTRIAGLARAETGTCRSLFRHSDVPPFIAGHWGASCNQVCLASFAGSGAGTRLTAIKFTRMRVCHSTCPMVGEKQVPPGRFELPFLD